MYHALENKFFHISPWYQCTTKIHINLAKMAPKISYFSVRSGTKYFISLSKVVPKVSYFSVHGGSTVGASIVAVGHVFAHLCTKQYIVSFYFRLLLIEPASKVYIFSNRIERDKGGEG